MSEPNECPGCRSRTRTFHDKLWNEQRKRWFECQNEWHYGSFFAAQPQEPPQEGR